MLAEPRRYNGITVGYSGGVVNGYFGGVDVGEKKGLNDGSKMPQVPERAQCFERDGRHIGHPNDSGRICAATEQEAGTFGIFRADVPTRMTQSSLTRRRTICA
jgi:hypothetical protein